MAILHGSWITQTQGEYLFIWGETWRRISPVQFSGSSTLQPHPLAMNQGELTDFLKSLQQLKGALPDRVFLLDKEVESNSQESTGKGRKKSNSKAGQKNNNSPPELENKVSPANLDRQNYWQSQVIALPTIIAASNHELTPQLSESEITEKDEELYLYPWQVEGICLDVREAIAFLSALPLGSVGSSDSYLGRDLRFWSHITRWSIDLLARSKFLPRLITTENDTIFARWQPLLDSAADRSRWQNFARQMPAACRTYQKMGNGEWVFPNIQLPVEPKEILWQFLGNIIDCQIRTVVSTHSSPIKEVIINDWLQALGSDSATMKSTIETVERLQATLNSWTAPVQPFLAGQSLFCTCFKVHPPASGETEWTLEYCLQAVDDPEFLIDAPTIWNHPVERLVWQGRTIELPQETLLRGLGLASRLMPSIESSLETPSPQFCRLNPLQAYEFIKNGAWRFQDSGLGVILPPSLANRDGWASRLGLSVRAETPQIAKKERLSLQSLLNFKWELSIGGQKLSKKEFDKLVALNTPLVEINGEWVELRPIDIKSADRKSVV